MNIRRCISFVLLLCVCLSVLFSPLHTVCATYNAPDYLTEFETNNGISTLSLDDTNVTSGEIMIRHGIADANWLEYGNTGNLTMGNDLSGLFSCNITSSPSTSFHDSFSLKRLDGAVMFDEGDSFKFEVTNVSNYLAVTNLSNNVTTNYNFDTSVVTEIVARFNDIDGTTYYLASDDFTVKQNGNKVNYEINFTDLPCDVYSMSIFYIYDSISGYKITSSNFNTSNYKVIRHFGFNNSDFSFETVDKKEGLLSSIIELIKSIITGITELPTKIKNALSSLFDMVVNALVDLGNFIIDGIKNLFIPSEDDITAMQDKWNTLLEDRFGALYQVIDLIHDYAAAFTNHSKGTITFPSVTIPLGESNFVFGGWEVKVVPDGFSIVFDTLKIIISILATCLFANGLKNRFEKLVGGSDNI